MTRVLLNIVRMQSATIALGCVFLWSRHPMDTPLSLVALATLGTAVFTFAVSIRD